MSGFLENLYTNFLLRDILAKAVPGFLVLFYLFPNVGLSKDWFSNMPDIVAPVVVYALSYVTGMTLQFLGTRKITIRKKKVSLIRIHVHKDVTESLEKLKGILTRNDDNQKSLFQQRERFVVFKTLSGNYFMALFAILVSWLIKVVGEANDLMIFVKIVLVLIIFFGC